jgi:hypothetical protein
VKEVYLYNYLKANNTASSLSRFTRPVYSVEIMCIKIFMVTMYPTYRLFTFFFEELDNYLLIYIIFFGILFYTLNINLVENNIENLIKDYNEKTKNEIARIRLKSIVVKLIILILNILLFIIK